MDDEGHRHGILALGAIIILFATKFFIFGLIAGGIGIGQLRSKSNERDKFIAQYRDIETRFQEAEKKRNEQRGNGEFLRLKASLAAIKNEFDGLPTEEKRRIDAHNTNRRAEQLRDFLDTFQICRYKISQIGPAKLAALTSFGIETAADVSAGRVQSVPGFGPVNSQPLLEWRAKMERGFKYDPNPTPADTRAVSAIRSEIARKATELKT